MKIYPPIRIPWFILPLAVVLLTVGSPLGLFSQDEETVDVSNATSFAAEPYYPYHDPFPLTTRFRFGNDVNEADIDLTAPLFINPSRSLALFTSIIYNRRDTGEESYSLGLGARWMVGVNSVLGFRVHGDRTETHFGNEIDQLGLGLDLFLANGIDVNANFYIPNTDKKLARQFRETRRWNASQQVTTQTQTFGNPFATGNTIFQNQIDTTNIVRQDTSTDVSQLFQQHEAGRQGADVRASFNLPIFKNRDPEMVRGTVGGYHYDGPFDGDLTGLMAGLNINPLRGVNFGVEYYDDEEVYGSNWIGTVGVSIPLETEKLLRPREWPAALANAFSPRTRDTLRPGGADYLPSRLITRAPRHNRVLSDVSAVVEDPTQRQILSQTTTNTLISSTPVTTVKTIRQNVIFVDANNGTVGGAGTAEQPVNTIQGGVTALAGIGGAGTVFVKEGTYNQAADNTIQVGHGAGPGITSVHFASTFKGINACGGLTFCRTGNRPLVDTGGFDIRGGTTGSVQVAQVQGLAFNGGTSLNAGGAGDVNSSITGLNVGQLTIDCNFIDGMGVAMGDAIVGHIQAMNTGTINILNNTIQNVANTAMFNGGQRGIFVQADNNATISGGRIDGNTILNHGLDNVSNGMNNNTNDHAIQIQAGNGAGSVINLSSISGNTITNVGTGGMTVAPGGNSNNAHGILINGNGGPGGTNNASVVTIGAVNNNTISGINNTGSDGIRIQSRSNAAGGMTINSLAGNNISNVGTNGIQLSSLPNNGSMAGGTVVVSGISGNTISQYATRNAAADGIFFNGVNGGNPFGTITYSGGVNNIGARTSGNMGSNRVDFNVGVGAQPVTAGGDGNAYIELAPISVSTAPINGTNTTAEIGIENQGIDGD